MDVLKHPALTSVCPEALKSRVNGVACGNVSHSSVPKSGVAGFQLGHQFMDFFLEDLWVGTRQDLISAIASQGVPIHTVHSGIEMFGRYQPANFIENLCAVVESQIHRCLIPIGLEVSPTGMNAAQ
jgi:hypothetical protein